MSLSLKEQEKIQKSFTRTKSISSVEKETGYSYHTIVKYVGYKPIVYNTTRIVEVYLLSGSLDRVAKILNISRVTVWRQLKKAGVSVGSGTKSWKRLYNTLRRRVSKSDWRLQVLQICNSKCILCDINSNVVHHIKKLSDLRDQIIKEYPDINPFNSYQELRKFTDLVMSLHKIEDGVVLCTDCHEKEHSANNGKLKRSLNIKICQIKK
jgi:biotin operon repressor